LLLTDLTAVRSEIQVGDAALAQAKQAPGGGVFSGPEGFVDLEGEIEAGWGSCETVSDG
jgi:hypothetical protein